MTKSDILRAFMARVNSHHDRDITTLFTVERNTLSEVVAHMQKVERSMTRRQPKPTRFPTPAPSSTDAGPSGHLKQLMQMEERMAAAEKAQRASEAKYQALQATMAAARRIAKRFESSLADWELEGSSVGVSIGAAHRSLSGAASPQELIRHADEAMYAAKKQGRHLMLRAMEDGKLTLVA